MHLNPVTLQCHSTPCHEFSDTFFLRLLDSGPLWVAAKLEPHTWRRNTKQHWRSWGCSWAAVILSRKMPERFVPSISRKRLTQTCTRIVCLTSAMELMNLLPKVRQHCWSLRNPAPETISCTNSLSWRKKAFVLSFAAELLASLPGTNSFPIPVLRVIPTLTHYSDIFWHIIWKYIYIWYIWHNNKYIIIIIIYIYSDILSGIYSDILFGILSGIYYDILSGIYIYYHSCWHSFWHPFWHSIWPFIWHSTFKYSGILSDICSDILSGSLSGILSGLLSDTLSDILPCVPGDGLSVSTKVPLLLFLLLFVFMLPVVVLSSSSFVSSGCYGHAWTRTHARENVR